MTGAPNIVFLLADQLRADFVGAWGADFLETPNLDALAAGGLRFADAISPAPVCVPARASMLTGQSAQSCGVIDNLAWLRPDRAAMGVRTWPEFLGARGYRTAAIGKMHFYPWDASEGFDERIIAEDKRHIHIADDYAAALAAAGHAKRHAREMPGYHASGGAGLSPLPDDLQPDAWVGRQAADWIAAAPRDRPFALMVGFPGPHCPYDPSARALARIDRTRLPRPRAATPDSLALQPAMVASYRRDWADLDYSTLTADQAADVRAHYAALVEGIDAEVARILGALDASGQLENTVVIFASDHGDYLGDFGLMGKTWFHEPSIHVPLILRDFRPVPVVRAGVRHDPVSLVDMFATLLDLAGAPAAAQAEGPSLLAAPLPGRVIVGYTVQGMLARDGRWKLVRYPGAGDGGLEALFDLANDPDEQHDCIDAWPQERARLDRAAHRALIAGLRAAHADKRVPAAQSPPGHPFYQRGWSRPYPAPAES